jgi:hypothetical protein
MNLVTRIEELTVQHNALETALEERGSERKTDDTEIHNLKKKKLLIKDEIARLS